MPAARVTDSSSVHNFRPRLRWALAMCEHAPCFVDIHSRTKTVLPFKKLFFGTPNFLSLQTICFLSASQFHCHRNLCLHGQFPCLKLVFFFSLVFLYIPRLGILISRQYSSVLYCHFMHSLLMNVVLIWPDTNSAFPTNKQTKNPSH